VRGERAHLYSRRQDLHGEAGMVAVFCGHLVAGRRPAVFGEGRETRDWVDVSDVVRANPLAPQSPLTAPIDIGRGRETSVIELVDVLREVVDSCALAEPQCVPARRGEVGHSCLDVTRARRELALAPQFDLREGLRAILAGR
jgi:UDP-glucose 4-epimerase